MGIPTDLVAAIDVMSRILDIEVTNTDHQHHRLLCPCYPFRGAVIHTQWYRGPGLQTQ